MNYKNQIKIKDNFYKKRHIRSQLTKITQIVNRKLTLSDVKFILNCKVLHNKYSNRVGDIYFVYDSLNKKWFPELSYKELYEKFIQIMTYEGERKESFEWNLLKYGYEEATRKKQLKSSRVSGENNPAFNHGGKLSPFSKNFIKYEGKSEEEINNILDDYNESRSEFFKNNPEKTSTKKEFWLNQGYSEEEALEKLSERQKTFSLDICVKKYGKKEGHRVWKERQEKWQTTLDSKTDEEKYLINKLKVSGKSISINEQELYDLLKKDIPNLEQQVQIKYNNKYKYLYDICIGNKIIEYNGDFWHANPKTFSGEDIHRIIGKKNKEIWKRDKHKYDIAIQNGYEVLII